MPRTHLANVRSLRCNVQFIRVQELTNKPIDITVDNPTTQGYEIKQYLDIERKLEQYFTDLEVEELVKILMAR